MNNHTTTSPPSSADDVKQRIIRFIQASVGVIREVIPVIGPKGISSGELYAILSGGGITIQTYESLISIMMYAKLIEIKHHFITLTPDATKLLEELATTNNIATNES